MKAEDLLDALQLPAAARVERRIPKALLAQHGAPTAADRRAVGTGIEELAWVAALKPTTMGVPAYRDEACEYLEIAVLRITLRGDAKVARLTEIVHRAVPYPLVLVSTLGSTVQLSLAHKRWSLGEAGRVVLDGDIAATAPTGAVSSETAGAFLATLALSRQPQSSLFALYGGWIDAVLSLEAARRTGHFAAVNSLEHSAARREALAECSRLESEMARIRSAATLERQIPRQVELNLELKRLEARRAAALARL
jgi:hypothetical protein